ncbi:MAG: hypothetical protein AB8G17_02285 [Gammaproteobacteria bacterium]
MFRKVLSSVLAVSMLMGVTTTQAQWPSDPQSPLILGELLGFGPDHEVVTTPDGATWIAWIDHQCFANLRLQRIGASGALLSPGGLILETRDNCDSLAPRIVALDDSSVIVSAVNFPSTTQPAYRVDATGQQLWAVDAVGDPVLADNVEQLMTFDNGDTLIAGSETGTIRLGRFRAAGDSVWDPATVNLTSSTGSNMRVFALVTDGEDGAYILWDAPGTYTRTVLATRIDALGTPVWANPVVLVAQPPGSSRHTDPVALADGLGGLILVWTQGAEQSTTPVPIRMQHVDAAGNTMLVAGGERISLSPARQFDVRATRHPLHGDVFIVWRDGSISDQSVRAQRMGLFGERLWGDNGIQITAVDDADSQYSVAPFDDNSLGIVIGDTVSDTLEASVKLYRVSTDGQQTSATIALSGSADADAIKSVALNGAMTVVWQRDTSSSQNELVAQRVRLDGTLGAADGDGDGIDDAKDNCLTVVNNDQRDTDADGFGNACDADLSDDCVVNIVDLGILRTVFFTADANADFNGDGVVNITDLGILRQMFFLPPGPSGVNATCAMP